MEVQIEKLKSSLEILFEHLQRSGISSVTIEDDYYWNVPKGEAYDATKDPSDLDLGQLTEDWEKLQAIVMGESPAIGYGLVWAAALLRRIGELNVS